MAAFHVRSCQPDQFGMVSFWFILLCRLSGVPDWTPHIQPLHLLYLVSVTTGCSTVELGIANIWDICEMNRNDFLCRFEASPYLFLTDCSKEGESVYSARVCQDVQYRSISIQLIQVSADLNGPVAWPSLQAWLSRSAPRPDHWPARCSYGAMAQGPWFWTTVTFGCLEWCNWILVWASHMPHGPGYQFEHKCLLTTTASSIRCWAGETCCQTLKLSKLQSYILAKCWLHHFWKREREFTTRKPLKPPGWFKTIFASRLLEKDV